MKDVDERGENGTRRRAVVDLRRIGEQLRTVRAA